MVLLKGKKAKLLNLAVVRGIQPRMTEVNFYSFFERFKVKVIGDKRTGWIVEEKIPGNVEYINLPLTPVWGFDPWSTFGGVLQEHRSFQFVKGLEAEIADCDVLNVSDLFYFYCWQTARLAAKHSKKLVAIVWETLPHHPSTYVPPYCFGVRKVLSTANLFIARSKKAKEYLLSIGAPEQKIRVIYKGIELSAFKPGERKSDGKLRILYVGQLVRSKGVVELLRAFERLHSEFDHAELWLLGRSSGEPLERLVKKMTRQLPVIVKSQVDYDRLPKIYQQADIYCHLSQDWKYLGLVTGGNDWFPYAVLEAMASGLPVVATGVGGIPEQLGDVGNIFVKQKDAESVYQGLKKFILDKDLRERVGRENRARAERMFEIKAQAQKTEETILELLQR